jgi:hypothetical protein
MTRSTLSRSSLLTTFALTLSLSLSLAACGEGGIDVEAVGSGAVDPATLTEADVASRASGLDVGPNVDSWLTGLGSAQTGYQLRYAIGSKTMLAGKNGGFQFETASAIKILHHLTALRAIEAGTISKTTSETVSQVYVGSCPQWPAASTVTEPEQSTLAFMMKSSDNARTDAVRRRFGYAAINNTAALVGATKTVLQHRVGCGGDALGAPNLMTLDDAAKIYSEAFTGTLISDKDYMRSLMPTNLGQLNNVLNQEALFTYKKGSLPDGYSAMVKLAYKPGGYTLCTAAGCKKYRTIAGYLELPFETIYGIPVVRKYTFGMFIHGAPNADDADRSFNYALTELFRGIVRDSLGSFYE